MIYPAHIRHEDGKEDKIQTVAEHCWKSAIYASNVAPIGLNSIAYLAGLLHDLGKYTMTFKDYIERAATGGKVKKGSVNHTFAGVRFVLERWHELGKITHKNMASEVIAYAIGAHHGLFDCIDPEGANGFLHRMNKEEIFYDEAKNNFLTYCADYEELEEFFMKAESEMLPVIEKCKKTVKNSEELMFQFSLLGRMLLSTVIDADRRDTMEFMNNIINKSEENEVSWEKCLSEVEERIFLMPRDSDIDKARHNISEQCKLAAEKECGIYKLNVPTGGGKTLSSLRYALATAARHHKKRIIFIIPLLSVLEQNAGVIRKYVNDDSLVLEHHSNIIRETISNELNENEFLMETWNSPIIITTLVQLLNVLFSDKTSCIRRMQALADSVIIIDEVQSVPKKMLSIFNMALNFLCSVCNATIVLSSATHPCLDAIPHPICYSEDPDLVNCDPALWEVFNRTKIHDYRRINGYSIQELSTFIIECMKDKGSVLLVCNKKNQAKELYNTVSGMVNEKVFHLSTAMCMAHRIETLEEINICLKQKERIICIATQMVEAGVDFSFASAIRVSAGIDNAIQVAGRCNRSGEYGKSCPVYIVNLKEENLSNLKEIEQSQYAAESVLYDFSKNPDKYDNNLSSHLTIKAYYHRLYTDMPNHAQEYLIPAHGTTLYKLLSDNNIFGSHCKNYGHYIFIQAFKTAGEEFCVFDDNTQDVLVPYKEGEIIIAGLLSEKAKYDFNYKKKLLEKAKRYTISLYDYEIKVLTNNRGIVSIYEDTIIVLQSDFYSEKTGFHPDGGQSKFSEV